MEKLKQEVEALFQAEKEKFTNQRFRYKNGNFGVNAMIDLIEKHTHKKVFLICFQDGLAIYYKKVLDKIFSQSPIPNNLKNPKAKYLDRKLRFGAIYNIITKYAPEVQLDFEVLEQ